MGRFWPRGGAATDRTKGGIERAARWDNDRQSHRSRQPHLLTYRPHLRVGVMTIGVARPTLAPPSPCSGGRCVSRGRSALGYRPRGALDRTGRLFPWIGGSVVGVWRRRQRPDPERMGNLTLWENTDEQGIWAEMTTDPDMQDAVDQVKAIFRDFGWEQTAGD